MTETEIEIKTAGENARDQILDSAIKVFSQKGFGGTRLREIAEHASVSHAMIKYYFGDKEQLWRAAVDFLFERQAHEIGSEFKSIRSGDTATILRFAIEHMIRYSARHPEHARLVMQASMMPGPHLDLIVNHLRKLHGLYYAALADSDALDTLDSTTVAMHYLMYGACHTIFTLGHEARGVYGIDVTGADFVDMFVQLATRVLVEPALQTSVPNSAAGMASASKASMGTPEIHTQETDDALEFRIVIPKLSGSNV